MRTLTHKLFSSENNTTAEDDWDSDDTSSNSDTSDSVKPECISSPHRKTLIDGNISRKQGHVIIPLNCSTEVRICQDTTAPPRDSPLADSFFQQLATIQTETRRKLREAKSTGTIFSSNKGWLGYFAISDTKFYNSIFFQRKRKLKNNDLKDVSETTLPHCYFPPKSKIPI